MKRTITLTHEQAVKLTSYILMTTNYRKGEREAWASLSAEKAPDGTLRYPNAPGNYKFWEEMERDLEAIRKIIDDSPLLDD